METSHLVNDVNVEDIETDEVYDREVIESSINEILGANSSIEQSSEEWMQDVSEKIEEITERYFNSAVSYINGEKFSLEDEARDMAETMHSLDQILELLSFRSGVRNNEYRERLLEIKNRLDEEVTAPVTAEALQYGDFTDNIPDEDVDYLLKPVRDNYSD